MPTSENGKVETSNNTLPKAPAKVDEKAAAEKPVYITGFETSDATGKGFKREETEEK